MADYIPRADAEFMMWADNFMNYTGEHLADLGINAPDMAQLSDSHLDFRAQMAAHLAARQAAKSARQAKDDSRYAFESAVRKMARWLQISPNIDNAERAALGIKIADTVKTLNIGRIGTRPIGIVDTSQRLRHEIRFSDEATPAKRAKPAGVMGCEIWVKITAPGDAATIDVDELSFLAMDTASPYIAEYDSKEGGMTAHYMLRWAKSDGKKGPWSETVSATITM